MEKTECPLKAPRVARLRFNAPQIFSTVAICCGLLFLLTGGLLILVWAFVLESPKTTHAIGTVSSGAVLCTIGVGFLLCSVVCLCSWQVRLARLARQSSDGGTTTTRPSLILDELPQKSTGIILGSLKKANSTTYISFGCTSPERLQVLSLVRGGIASAEPQHSPPLRRATTLREPSTSLSVGSPVMQLPDGEPSSTAYDEAQPLARASCLRRSLPRSSVQLQAKKTNSCETAEENRSDQLEKANSEGLKLDRLSRRRLAASRQPPPTSADASRDIEQDTQSGVAFIVEDTVDDPVTSETTRPPVTTCQDSLFNLTQSRVTMATSDMSTTPHKQSRTSLRRTTSGKRCLLMHQSGQLMISCATLFGDEEYSDLGAATSLDDTTEVGRSRHVQVCKGWNVFPVIVEPPGTRRYLKELGRTATTPNNLTSSDEGSGVKAECGELWPSSTGNDLLLNDVASSTVKTRIPVQHQPHNATSRVSLRRKRKRVMSFAARVRRFLQRHMGTTTGISAEGDHGELHESGELADVYKVLFSTCPTADTPRESRTTQPIPHRPSHGSSDHSSCSPPDDSDAQNRQLKEAHSSTSLKPDRHRKQTVQSNASVFSLPAIPPEMWSADRPVWIMGVPVHDDDRHWLALDACDHHLILLNKQQQHKNPHSGSGEAVLQRSATGSNSSMYAFHVKPPKRLQPTGAAFRLHQSHGRARSLGRILMSEKRASSPPG